MKIMEYIKMLRFKNKRKFLFNKKGAGRPPKYLRGR